MTYDPTRVALADMAHAVDTVGFTVPTAEITLQVNGMTCASCVGHVQQALTEIEGVLGAAVNLGLGTARVTYIPGLVTVTLNTLLLKRFKPYRRRQDLPRRQSGEMQTQLAAAVARGH